VSRHVRKTHHARNLDALKIKKSHDGLFGGRQGKGGGGHVKLKGYIISVVCDFCVTRR
jgi:hypothetical protein